eukprot:212966_1
MGFVTWSLTKDETRIFHYFSMSFIWRKREQRPYIHPKNLQLTNLKNRPRLILCLKPECANHANAYCFYEKLCHKSRNEINSLLFELYDKYHPKIMDTNCGQRTNGMAFHCKLIFELDDFINLLKENESVPNPIFKKTDEANDLNHFKNVAKDYVIKHEGIEMRYYQKDLQLYKEVKNMINNNSGIYDYKLSETYLKHFIENEISFDTDHLTSIYSTIKTNETNYKFKMKKYEP